ncbi:hypothetical protein PHLCEN_2v8778 [Hermanssonia centrifuga]|uniref:Uncharacterized protein n=1 Tax=Hermanssonia centrifuga TaxID=98765 RepID=A0A2R6NSG2_9APHY|nr:hypothetical protein PHLCEN_2v8778 [Hermanssonia centrifuga]
MSRFIASTVTSIARPPLLVILISEEQAGWCKQFSEEGYDVVHILFPPNAESPLVNAVQEANQLAKNRADHYWALITYGADSVLLRTVTGQFDRQNLKVCVHFCPAASDGDGLVANNTDGPIPTIFHLSTNQDALNASLVEMIDSISLQHAVPTSCYPPVVVHTYPKVTADPPFPYSMKAPALVTAGETSSVGPYIRSAVGLSYTRTLELLRRHLGPHFDLEGLWEKHTYYVSAPYVNHVPTMTGGVGFKDLARFYKVVLLSFYDTHLLTRDLTVPFYSGKCTHPYDLDEGYLLIVEQVTPPDTELITISRTGMSRVGLSNAVI